MPTSWVAANSDCQRRRRPVWRPVRLVQAASIVASVWLLSAEPRAHCPDERRGRADDADHLQYVEVNGVRIAYRIEGAGIPVIFIHGETHSHELWTRQIESVRNEYLFLSYDRRGHGESGAPCTGYSPIAHAEDLEALMRHLRLREAHFVVSSRGGLVILQFLRLRPEMVRSIIFADAALALWQPPAPFREARRRNQQPASLEDARAQRRAATQASFYAVARSQPNVQRILERMIAQYSLRVLMNPQRARDSASPLDYGPWNDRLFPDMRALGKPTLLIVGDRTHRRFIENATIAAKSWPRTRCHVVYGADHLLMLEEAEEFNRVALAFLTAVDTGKTSREPGFAGTPSADLLPLTGCEPTRSPQAWSTGTRRSFSGDADQPEVHGL